MNTNILIIDDSLTVRMDLVDTFAEAGFETFPCSNAEQAREMLRTQTIDLVVLDVSLPDADGVELLRELRAAGYQLPVLILASESAIGERARDLNLSSSSYVGKPYDPSHVIQAARVELERRTGQNRVDSQADIPTILIIEDSATYRHELSSAIAISGYRPITATNGEDGLRMVANARPAAVLVDGILPGISGPTVIRRIRLDAALRSVPCLLLTATQTVDAELEALESGADGFVRKDGDVDMVLAKLHALLRASRDERGANLALSTETTRPLAVKRLLTVDDSLTFRRELASFLLAEGYDVLEASSGEEALDLLTSRSVDCVLLDLEMPGLGGRETCRRIKSAPELRGVPVIVLTGIEGRTSMLDGLALGADDFIQKSSEFEVLKARVRAQLRRRQIEEETRQVREQLLRSEMRVTEAIAARKLVETRAALVDQLEQKNRELREVANVKELLAQRFQVANEKLERAYRELQDTQAQLIQSAKLASLGELVAGVAHEINNPLAFVISHLDTARSCLQQIVPACPPADSPFASEKWTKANVRLSEMSLGLDRIRNLVVKLRAFSRLDEGERKSAHLRDCIDSVLTILRHRCKRGVTIETSCDAALEIDCYPGLLNQALMNLVANAIDAVGTQGSISVCAEQDSNGCVIAITDNGVGIPAELRERVLEPFFTTKPVGQGTGLGLSMTYAIIKKHQGVLELNAAPQGGTQVIVRLPISVQEFS